MRKTILRSSLVTLLSSWANLACAEGSPTDCPKHGTGEVIENPTQWADQCFVAINMRSPEPSAGETYTAYRDIDLDGADERLEIRGTGNATKQIYVFSIAPVGYLYMGELIAHPSFEVLDEGGRATIVYIHRFGASETREKIIRYIGNEFVIVSSELDR